MGGGQRIALVDPDGTQRTRDRCRLPKQRLHGLPRLSRSLNASGAADPADVVPAARLDGSKPGVAEAGIGDQDRRGVVGQDLGQGVQQVGFAARAAILVMDLLENRQGPPGERYRGAQQELSAAIIDRRSIYQNQRARGVSDQQGDHEPI